MDLTANKALNLTVFPFRLLCFKIAQVSTPKLQIMAALGGVGSMNRLLCVITAAFLGGCSFLQLANLQERVPFGRPSDDSVTVDVSPYLLVANPEIYNGRRVRTTGILRIEYEGSALYVDMESYINRLSLNALALHFNPSALAEDLGVEVDQLLRLNGYVATVDGMFEGALPEPPCEGLEGEQYVCIHVGVHYGGYLKNLVHIEAVPYESAP